MLAIDKKNKNSLMTEIVSLMYSKSITSKAKREFLIDQSLALAPFALVANWLKTPVRASICVVWKFVVLID